MARVTLPRRLFVIGLALAIVILFGLVVTIFRYYPSISSSHGTGPAPIFPVWFGTTGATMAYILLGAYLLCLYIGLGVLATPSPASSSPLGRWQPWQIGGLLGATVGIVVFVVGVPVNLLPQTGGFSAIALLVWVVALVAAGVLGGQATGRILGGVLAGVWCGIVIALLSSLLGLGQDLLLAPLLVHGAWANDSTCPYLVTRTVASCETSDDLGWYASVLTALPVVGALFGGLGGLVHGAEAREARDPAPVPRIAVVIPFAFLILQAALFAGELIWSFW
jgi:hypothetical protein